MYLTTILAALLLLSTTLGMASTMNSFSNLRVGDMSLSFSPDNGFSLEYGGASVFKESSLRVMKPGWLATYYSYEMGDKNISISDISGGKEVIVHHKTPGFEGEHIITVLPDKITFDLKYKLLADVPDAGIEYNIGYLSAPLVTGQEFDAVTAKGTESGKVPLEALSSGWDGFVTRDSFDKITFNSRIGKMTVETNGDPNDLWLVDARGLRVTWAEKNPVFMLSAPRKPIKKDEEHHSVITISFAPISERAKPIMETSEPAAIREISDLRKTTPKPVVVIPEPQDMKLLGGDFVLNDQAQIVVGNEAKEEDLRGAKSFAAEVRSLYNIKLPIVHENEASGQNLILVGEAALNHTAADAAKAEKITAPAKDEGYALKVTPERVIVLGHDQRGTYYGMQTLKQLVKVSADAITLQGCDINDYPSLPLRGIHIYTGNKALPFHEKLVDRILSRYKMNLMLLECDQIEWKCAPEIKVSFAMPREDVKKDIAYANDHFIDVYPQVSSLGHMHWIFANHQHRDLAENPDHPYAYCPSNPESYKFIFKIYDEAVELFNHPKYFHIGHDEVTSVEAEFPHDAVCKQKTAAQLFIEDTLKIYDHLKKQGIGVMMWGDMMLAPGEAPDACNMPDAKTADWMRKSLPKDIIITDWHYAIDGPESYHSLKLFQDQGLKCIASTWYTPANIRNFSQAAKNNNSLGLLQTTWAGFDSNEHNLVESRDQFTAYVLAAEYAWNSGKTDLEKLKYQADNAFFSQWDRQPPKRECLKGFTVDLSKLYNASLANSEGNVGWVGSSAENDLSSAPVGNTRLGDDTFSLAKSTSDKSAIRLSSALDDMTAYPEGVTIPSEKTADSLIFLMTSVWSDTPGRIVGSIKVNYADGTSKEIKLVYRKNIAAWTDKGTCSDATVAWESETRSGQYISLREMEWKNPNPDKAISSVEIRSENTDAGPVLLGLSGISTR